MADEILQSFADRATMTQGLKKREFNYNDSFKFTITFDMQDMWDLTDKKPEGWLKKKIADTKAALIENIKKNFDNDVQNNLNPQMIDFSKPVNWLPPINPDTKKEERAEGAVYLKEEYISEKYTPAIESAKEMKATDAIAVLNELDDIDTLTAFMEGETRATVVRVFDERKEALGG